MAIEGRFQASQLPAPADEPIVSQMIYVSPDETVRLDRGLLWGLSADADQRIPATLGSYR
jgi:hypothetical protein